MNNQNKNDDTLWDSVCFHNPYQTIQDDGKKFGKYSGSVTGYADGYQLGITTALSHGIEIGFINGVIQSIAASMHEQKNVQKDEGGEEEVTGGINTSTRERVAILSNDGEKFGRLQKSISLLQKLINDFPSPDTIFQENIDDTWTAINDAHKRNLEDATLMETSVGSKSYDDDYCQPDDTENISSATSPSNTTIDIAQHLQRIRARYRLFIIQLNLPSQLLQQLLSLNYLMNELHTNSNQNQNAGVPTIPNASESNENITSPDW